MRKKDPFILMYHGMVAPDRGIEMLIKITAHNKNVQSVILGDGEDGYIHSLNQVAKKLHILDRVIFHPAVNLTELWKYVGAADVGMILAPAVCENHLYSLPNKFFENIQSETPIICPDYPAMAAIIRKYQIGLTCDPTDMREILVCIERMRQDNKFYSLCRKNLKIAKRYLCWERESMKLKKAYSEVL